MLQFKGYRTSVARNGKEAIDIARNYPPDLVLLDVMMPEVDGVTVCRTFRDDPHLRDVRILMLTARSGRQDVVRALEAGASDYVTKPFFFDELVARIRTNMEVKRYHDDLAAMLRISQAVSSSLDSDKVLYTIVSELGEVVQAEASRRRAGVVGRRSASPTGACSCSSAARQPGQYLLHRVFS